MQSLYFLIYLLINENDNPGKEANRVILMLHPYWTPYEAGTLAHLPMLPTRVLHQATLQCHLGATR